MEKETRLYKDPIRNSIMAEHTVNGFPDDEIRSIMGTHIIPTAYTTNMSLVEAGRKIGMLNPGYIVKYQL